jgi:hypothetical protein
LLQEVIVHSKRFNIQHLEERAWVDVARRELVA